MLKPFIKYIILTSIAFISLYQLGNAQDFIKEYRKHLLSTAPHIPKVKKNIKANILKLKTSLDRFEIEKGHPFAATDTVYIVSIYGVETGFPSALIWNKKESLFYRYTFSMENWKITDEKLDIKTDASNILESFGPHFKRWVETADTASYSNYAKTHWVFDGSAMSFTRAIKSGNHWSFISSKSYATDL